MPIFARICDLWGHCYDGRTAMACPMCGSLKYTVRGVWVVVFAIASLFLASTLLIWLATRGG